MLVRQLLRPCSFITSRLEISPIKMFASDGRMDPICRREAPLLENKGVLAHPDDIAREEAMKCPVEEPELVNTAPVSGVPDEHVGPRRIRIYIRPKNAMQSGTDSEGWEIEFDNRQRWENPAMGWCSTGDPVSNCKLQFPTKEDAIYYCTRQGYQWYLDIPKIDAKWRVKNYAVNFSWNKRTRVQTK